MAVEKSNVIWRQISVGVKMRIGARKPLVQDGYKGFPGYLCFQVGPGRSFFVRIFLTQLDEYNMELIKISRKHEIVLESASGAYAEDLSRILVEWEGIHLAS